MSSNGAIIMLDYIILNYITNPFHSERIKAKNVPLQRRLVLVDPNEPKRCVDTSKVALRHSNLMSDMAKRRAVSVS